jgi:hypothetical protein
MPLDDGINDAGSGGEEEFKLLDIEGSAATSYRNTASVITVSEFKSRYLPMSQVPAYCSGLKPQQTCVFRCMAGHHSVLASTAVMSEVSILLHSICSNVAVT